MTTRLKSLFALILTAQGCLAQQPAELSAVAQQRFRMIDYYHFDFGLGAESDKNTCLWPRFGVGVGTWRNLVNARVEIGYAFTNLFASNGANHLSAQSVTLGATLDFNLLKWQASAFYVGGNATWRAPVISHYYDCLNSQNISDGNIGHSHASLSAHLGVRIMERWSAQIGYVYDLAPQFGQRHVFESAAYDYDDVHTSLFERGRVTLSMFYQIPF